MKRFIIGGTKSGCGKTTTGRAIIRLLNPTAGTVRFDGREISGKMTGELSRFLSENIAMVFHIPKKGNDSRRVTRRFHAVDHNIPQLDPVAVMDQMVGLERWRKSHAVFRRPAARAAEPD